MAARVRRKGTRGGRLGRWENCEGMSEERREERSDERRGGRVVSYKLREGTVELPTLTCLSDIKPVVPPPSVSLPLSGRSLSRILSPKLYRAHTLGAQ